MENIKSIFIEFTLPGKNGLDIAVQRLYSTAKALEDSTEGDKTDIDGEKVWKIADGWRINMPYMMWNSNSIEIYGTDGNCTSLAQMTVINDGREGNKKKLYMESHEYTDLTAEFQFRVADHRFLWWKWETFKFDNAVLHQGDGKKVYYGKDGKVEKITDRTGKNKISFKYEKDRSIVTDSYGREIIFKIEDGYITGIESGAGNVVYAKSTEAINSTDKNKDKNTEKKEM